MNTIDPRGGITTTRGEGSYFEGVVNDRRMWYLDFFTDSGTASLGHGCYVHDTAMRRAFGHPLHSLNMFDNDLRNRVAERVCKAVGFDRIFFSNSGAESVETAIKLARKYQADKTHEERDGATKDQIWSVKGSFHGRTYGALAASDGPPYHFEGFHPMPEGFYTFEKIEDINFRLAAAVIISPVYCNNDVRMYDNSWLFDLEERCRETGTLLIYDEIQTGCGRTGEYAYSKIIGARPDITTLAKGFGMGYPVAATLAREGVAKAFTPGTHFATFGGSPPALVHVDTMFEWLKDNRSEVRAMENIMREGLDGRDWVEGPVRGIGMFIAFDLRGDAMKFAAECLDRGLVIGAFRSNPVKLTPPLNLTNEEWESGLRIMNEAAKKC